MPERELPDLEGYRGSRPVRIGNAAATQFQLDAYGQLLDTAWRYCEHRGELGVEFRHLLRDAAQILARRWDEPDHGIWEVRTAPQRFITSLLFAWVGIDRGVRLADELELGDVEAFEHLGHRVRDEVLKRGTRTDTDGFTRIVEGGGSDASNLLLPLLLPLQGLVEPDDPQVDALLRDVRDRLAGDDEGTLLLRYRDEDGVPGGEGAFVLCSFWLVSVLAARGEVDEATRVFEAVVARANDLGLLAEEIDPATGDLLGNFPQAISHAGLIDAALQLEAARERFHAGGGERLGPWASGEWPEGDPQQTPIPRREEPDVQARQVHEIDGLRTFVVVFDRGDDPKAGLEQFAREHGISGASVTAVGSRCWVTLRGGVTSRNSTRTWSSAGATGVPAVATSGLRRSGRRWRSSCRRARPTCANVTTT